MSESRSESSTDSTGQQHSLPGEEQGKLPEPQVVEAPQEPREDLVATAVRFLQNPRVSSSPLHQKKQFLLKKGLTNEEIDSAIRRAGPVHQVAERHGETHPVAAVVPLPPPLPPSPSPYPVALYSTEYTTWHYLRDISSTAALFGAVCYGVYYLYKRYLLPYLLGKSYTDEDKLAQVQQQVSALTSAVQQLKDAVKSLESSLGSEQRLLRETESVDAIKHDVALSDLKSEMQSIKGLLLSRKQFPSTPKVTPIIPTWQLEEAEKKEDSSVTSSSLLLKNSGGNPAEHDGSRLEAQPESGDDKPLNGFGGGDTGGACVEELRVSGSSHTQVSRATISVG